MKARITLAALVERHRRPPAKASLDIVEAASFLAFGGYIGSGQLAELFELELPKQGELPGIARLETKVLWSDACAATCRIRTTSCGWRGN